MADLMLQPVRNRHFIGRDDDLDRLHAGLATHPRALLSGPGGIGKSGLAVEYAHRHADAYAHVFWIFAGAVASLNAGYAALARRLDLPACTEYDLRHVVEGVQAWLNTHNGWLLVLDGADPAAYDEDVPARLRPFLPAPDAAGHVLITARSSDAGPAYVQAVAPLAPDAAVRFLLDRTERLHPAGAEHEAARDVAATLGGLPLALELAGAFIRVQGGSFADYLAAFRRRHEESDTLVTTAIALNVEQVEQDPACAEVLQTGALLAPDPIPATLFVEEGPRVKRIGTRPRPIRLPLEDVPPPLERYALLHRGEDNGTVTMHRLVQEVVSSQLTPAQRTVRQQRLVEAVARAMPSVLYPQWDQWTLWDAHLVAAMGHAIEGALHTTDAEYLLGLGGFYLMNRRRHAEAEPLSRRAFRMQPRLLADETPHAATSRATLADFLYQLGHHDRAISLFRKQVEVAEQEFGSDVPRTVQYLDTLGMRLRANYKAAAAEPFFRRVLEFQEQQGGTNPSTLVPHLDRLAWALYFQEKNAEAESLYRRAFEIVERDLGAGHDDTVQCLNRLASSLKAQEKYDEAEALYRKVLRLEAQDDWDADRVDPRYLCPLRELLFAREKFAAAEPFARRMVHDQEQSSTDETSELLCARMRLADILRAQRTYEEARALYKRVLISAERKRYIDEPRFYGLFVSALHKLAELHLERGEDAKAEILLRSTIEAFKPRFQPDRPGPLRARQQYARLLQKLKGDEDKDVEGSIFN